MSKKPGKFCDKVLRTYLPDALRNRNTVFLLVAAYEDEIRNVASLNPASTLG